MAFTKWFDFLLGLRPVAPVASNKTASYGCLDSDYRNKSTDIIGFECMTSRWPTLWHKQLLRSSAQTRLMLSLVLEIPF